MNYTNREVVRRLKQYDMFLNSLNLAKDEETRERICDQLDKIEKQILLETNTEYEEEYMALLNEETKFFSEEKSRLRNLISLVEERKHYLEERKEKHRKITGSLVELTTFLGEDKLTVFRKRLSIIEKYEENKTRQETLIKDMRDLDVKLSSASRNVKANARLNEILENKMMSVVGNALDKFNFRSLVGKRSEILNKHDTLEYALNLAKDNLKTARNISDDHLILECDEMLSQVVTEYSSYNEKVNILKLIDCYDRPVSNFDELLEKREYINDILKSISDSKIYNEVFDELSKEYNTIKLEKQDIENYNSLKEERELKNKQLYEIEEENNSQEFKAVVDELVKNENRIRDEKIRKARREEYQERQKKLLEEQKIEASRVRRQKLIEEARLKEQQERLEKVKELQEKTVINSKKEESNPKESYLNEQDEVSDDFDTDELFENTKIVPNKNLDEIDNTLLNVPVDNKENIEKDTWRSEEVKAEVTNKVQVEEENTKDLFKEEEKPKEVKVANNSYSGSIYDILENNKNIIWKTTDTNVNKDSIPVIGNNNLKPEIIENRKVNDIEFPNIDKKKDKKEGELLWKETL